MTVTVSRTPDDVSVTPRHPSFALDEVLAGDWHGGDPFKTAFFNALSLTFPIGETYFIDSVRLFQKDVTDPKLAREVRGFIGQEAIHRREHTTYNTRLCAARGYDAAPLEQVFAARVAQRAEGSAMARLMETAAFEHLTAILARGLLSDPAWLAGADPTLATLWRWHAIEEAEHKAVTFDVYQAVGGDMARLRSVLMPLTLVFLSDILRGVWLMLKSDGRHWSPRVWLSGMAWLFGRGGVLRRLYPHWRAFQRPGFHPWDVDDRRLIQRWKADEEPQLLAA